MFLLKIRNMSDCTTTGCKLHFVLTLSSLFHSFNIIVLSFEMFGVTAVLIRAVWPLDGGAKCRHIDRGSRKGWNKGQRGIYGARYGSKRS